jgi:hypothetical protein
MDEEDRKSLSLIPLRDGLVLLSPSTSISTNSKKIEIEEYF